MYRHILIPTDGSELAHKAVNHGLSLAKSVDGKVTVLIVVPSFNVYNLPASRTDLISSAFAEYEKHAKAHAAKVLTGVADEAQSAGVACETVQMTHDHPYEAIVATAKEKGCDLIVMASHGAGRDCGGGARQRHDKGPDAHENSGSCLLLKALMASTISGSRLVQRLLSARVSVTLRFVFTRNNCWAFTKRMYSAPRGRHRFDECNNAASTNKASLMAAARFGTNFL